MSASAGAARNGALVDTTMGKMHTHYDNLKVARMAPQEVVRAAYKALSQKYHPDKNQGSEKAARIMAILNTSYTTLSDPRRRREHDEWIAAAEWEFDRFESTRDEQRERHGLVASFRDPESTPLLPRYRREWKRWARLAACLVIGGFAGALIQTHTREVAPWELPQPDRREVKAVAPRSETEINDWTISLPNPPAPGIKVLAMSQVLVPGLAEDCRGVAALLAPNGAAWPQLSGYVEGFTVGNKGQDMQLLIDNVANDTDVFVRLFDIERGSNVRYVFVRAHDKLTVDQLAFGKYEVRYQHVIPGTGNVCDSRRVG